MRFSIVLAAALAFFALADTANADLITGEITMAGALNPTGGTDLSDATGIDFTDDAFIVIGTWGVPADEGVGFGDMGTIKDFDFDPLSGPIVDFWTVGGFSFELKTISVKTQNETFLNLYGSGFLTHDDYDDTLASWAFSTQLVNEGRLFSFSAHTVPEPTSLALAGFGALGIAIRRRRKKIAA